MNKTFPHDPVADVSDLFSIQSLDDFEAEHVRSMRIPRTLERTMRVRALPEREPEAVLDLGQVGRAADPNLTGRHAADGVDASFDLPLLVGAHSRLSVFGSHRMPSQIGSDAIESDAFAQYHPGEIDSEVTLWLWRLEWSCDARRPNEDVHRVRGRAAAGQRSLDRRGPRRESVDRAPACAPWAGTRAPVRQWTAKPSDTPTRLAEAHAAHHGQCVRTLTRLSLARSRARDGGEAAAARLLLEQITPKGVTVTMDALHCPYDTARLIRAGSEGEPADAVRGR